jgi:CBS domain containing-hemolysin-like protein
MAAACQGTAASPAETAAYALIVIGLLCVSGLMAGLVLGLFSLDRLDLEVIKRVGTASEKKWAEKVLPVIRNKHFLLVTLVTVNAGAASALPIVVNRLVNEWVAIVLSTTAILIFGEMIPQAACAK